MVTGEYVTRRTCIDSTVLLISVSEFYKSWLLNCCVLWRE